jgi:hypothetical protein
LEIHCTAKREYIEAMATAHDPLYESVRQALPDGDLADYVTSLDLSAVKPKA